MREKNSERPDTRDNRSKNSTKTGKKNTKNREFAVITYSFLALFILIIPDRRHLHRRSCAGRS